MDTSHAIQRHRKAYLPSPQVSLPPLSQFLIPWSGIIALTGSRVLYFTGSDTDTPKIPSESIKKAKRKVASASKEDKEASSATANEAKEGLKKRTKKVVE